MPAALTRMIGLEKLQNRDPYAIFAAFSSISNQSLVLNEHISPARHVTAASIDSLIGVRRLVSVHKTRPRREVRWHPCKTWNQITPTSLPVAKRHWPGQTSERHTDADKM